MNKKTRLTRLEKRKLISAIFLMATASIGPLFLITTADYTTELQATFGFVILVTVLIELGIQMNVWRILTVAGKPANVVINQIVPNFGDVLSVFVLLGGIAFNILNITGLGLGFNLLFGLDIKIGASIGVLIVLLIFMFKSCKDNLDIIVPAFGITLLIITFFTYLFIATDVPYKEVAFNTLIVEDIGPTIIPIASIVALTIGGYISFAGAHRLVDERIVGEKYKRKVTRAANYSVFITAIVRIFIFLIIFTLTRNNTILFEGNLLESAYLEIFGNVGSYALGVLFIIAALTSIIATTYTTGTFIKPINIVLSQHLNVVLVMFILTSWFIFLIAGEPKPLILVSTALNGIIIPIILGGLLHATRREDIVKNYKHPLYLSVYGVIVLIIAFILAFYSIRELSVLF